MSEDNRLPVPTNILAIIRGAFAKIRVDRTFQPILWNKWLPADVWVEALKTSHLIDETLPFNVKSFNAAMLRSKSEFNGLLIARFDGSNTTGVFRLTFQKCKFYYVTNEDVQAEYPKPLDTNWKAEVLATAEDVLLQVQSTSQASCTATIVSATDERKRRMICTSSDEERALLVSNKRQNTSSTEQSALTTPVSPPVFIGASLNCHDGTSTSTTSTQGEQVVGNQQVPPPMFFWNSQDACNLFGVTLERPEDDVRDALKLRIKLLQSVSNDHNGWRNVIEGRDPENICSAFDVFSIRGRSVTLCLAYQMALVHMNKWTWEQCCIRACRQLNQLGVEQATHHRTVQDWNNEFRKCEKFCHPNHEIRCGKRPMPQLFTKYPTAMDDIIEFGVKNLTGLTVEVVHSFCHDVLIPKLVTQWQNDMVCSRAWCSSNRELLTKEMFLREHGITTLSIPTCWRWLHRLGFTYDMQRKGYYVDGHERPDVVAARKTFCEVYLTELEPRCLRWMQFSQQELEMEAFKKLRSEVAYMYFDDEGTLNYEFHVDYCRNKGVLVGDELSGKVPTMSVRALPESKPIEIFGQDESVFTQFLFPPKSWVGPNQERGLFPKSNGEGLMISAFVSRDSGFGLPLNETQLARINAYRQGKQYVDKAAAREILKCLDKPPLTVSPFVKNLLIGASKGGYWNSFHMALQFEDIVDCLKIIRPEVDFVFLFDHSQGHARKQDGALDANDMSRSFGGVQPKLRNTIIIDECLGPHDCPLKIGDTQSMVFSAEDVGPWWMLTQETRESRRHDRTDIGVFKTVNRTRVQLADALKDVGIDVDPARPVSELKGFANQHGIPLQCRKMHVVEGWEGKPKGLLQILWERGWIDPDKCRRIDNTGTMVNTSFYTLRGKKNPNTPGEFNESSSLRYLMGPCRDFREEQTALQHLGSQLGVKVIFTPKFHCEFAGEGIEYNWAHAKAKMRATPLRDKKGRANFMNLVMKCICPATVLTKERISKFAGRARAYICTYYHLSTEEEHVLDNSDTVVGSSTPRAINIAEKQQLLYKEIERLMKKFKTHRCALDFDQRFVKAELKEEV